MKFVFGRVENIMGKGENAGYQNMIIIHRCWGDRSRKNVCESPRFKKN